MELTELKRPDERHIRLDYEQGTKLTLKTLNFGDIEGVVTFNPMSSKVKAEVVLCDVVLKRKKAEERKLIGKLRLNAEDIEMVLDVVQPVKSIKTTKLVERLFSTVVVNTEPEFLKLLERFERVVEVGLSFHGVNMGRKGKLSWISICCDNILFVIDALTLVQSVSNFWPKLEEALFANPKICKVFYNLRPAVDYLYHNFGVHLRNCFDLQVMDLILRRAENPEGHQNLWEERYESLSDMLSRRLGSKIIPVEISYLKAVESCDFSELLLERPLSSDRRCCKRIALETKYLMDLKMELVRIYEKRITHCMMAQMKEVINGEWVLSVGSQMINPLQVPHGVLSAVMSVEARAGSCPKRSSGRDSGVSSDGSFKTANDGGMLPESANAPSQDIIQAQDSEPNFRGYREIPTYLLI